MSDNPDNNEESADVSKSERKRQMHHLQALGEQLTQLSASQLATLPLPPSLAEAIATTSSIRKNEAKRRHLQYIGKLMRKLEADTIVQIENLFASLKQAHQQRNDQFHALENWRDRLLSGNPEEMEQFLEEFPNGDRQRLRQLARQHQQEVQRNKPPVAARKLFQYLKEVAG